MGKLTTLLTGILLISLIFMGMTTFLTDLTDNYDVNVDDKYEGTYAEFNQTNAELENISLTFQEKVESNAENPSILGWVDQLFYSAWSSLKMSVSSITMTNRMVDATTEVPGVAENSWITAGLKTLIILAITLLLIGFMIKRET